MGSSIFVHEAFPAASYHPYIWRIPLPWLQRRSLGTSFPIMLNVFHDPSFPFELTLLCPLMGFLKGPPGQYRHHFFPPLCARSHVRDGLRFFGGLSPRLFDELLRPLLALHKTFSLCRTHGNGRYRAKDNSGLFAGFAIKDGHDAHAHSSNIHAAAGGYALVRGP